ncbi:MAG: NAD(P)-dependent oxidoreductase [Gemmatimonadaceae bacterium]|nr:NAD(P)-dependent oxidoreductase [Gemmatimonadaceae bacterium]
MKIAFLGLGAMGAPMARHLAGEPFELTVWNRTAEKATAFATAHRAVAAATPADAVTGADVVITCLPSSREVEQLVEGESGIASGLKDGAIFIDCTSGDPTTSRAIAARLAERGIRFVDAPVSGGVKGAEAGTLTVMCGGTEAAVDSARPVLEAFGKKIVRCGDVGAGDAVKAMNQALLAIHIWSAGEALAALAKVGVNTHLALDVINGSSGRSNSSENLFPERVMGRAFPRTFKLALLDKDVSIAARIAEENGLPAPFIELAARLFAEAHGILGEEADHVEAVRVIEERAGVLIS